MPKVGFVSLGCPKNLVDSEVMMGVLARGGYEITARAADADVLVVNTCTFIEPAQKESVDSILEMAEYKKFGKAQKLIVAGCMVERFRNDIREQIPEVDAVIGTGEIEKILEVCEGQLRTDGPHAADLPTYLYHDLTPRILATPKHTAYIKINEGCDHPCTFCVIPQLRGKFRSRRFESVIREAENLAAAGVREISLIGQDTTYYGEDLGLRDGLATLLERLAQVEDLNWVRFLYCYPNRITPKLLDTIAAHQRLVKYLDVPLQHASRNVLARMRRGGNGNAFLKMLDKARKAIPGVSIRTLRFCARGGIRLAGRLFVFGRRYVEKLCPRRKSRCEDDCAAARFADGHPEERFHAKVEGARGQDDAGDARRAVERHRFDLGSAPGRHGAGNRRQGLCDRIRRRERCRGAACSGNHGNDRNHRSKRLRFDRPRDRV
jgi:hypothetical protein